MSEHLQSTLTPWQSADVIRYYHESAAYETRAISVGQAAIRTTLPRHSILPDGKPMLTQQEAREGLNFMKNPPKSDEYYRRLDNTVDRRNISYDDALRELDEEEDE